MHWVCPQRLLTAKYVFESHLGLVENKRLLKEGAQKGEKIGREKGKWEELCRMEVEFWNKGREKENIFVKKIQTKDQKT